MNANVLWSFRKSPCTHLIFFYGGGFGDILTASHPVRSFPDFHVTIIDNSMNTRVILRVERDSRDSRGSLQRAMFPSLLSLLEDFYLIPTEENREEQPVLQSVLLKAAGQLMADSYFLLQSASILDIEREENGLPVPEAVRASRHWHRRTEDRNWYWVQGVETL
jgi:hypothetical protein